jgi:hypothetical protein
MTFALAIRELWSRKGLLAIGVLLALAAAVVSVSNVSLFPPKLGKGTLEYYSGRTQILVDSSDSSIADLGRDFSPMVARANVYSRFLTTPTALRFIGERAGVPPSEIYAEGPYQLGQARFVQEPTAERSGSQLLGREARYRLRFDSDPELPIVVAYAEAPSAAVATALAEGAASGLAEYVERLQDQQAIPEKRRVTIRKLGSTTGEPVTAGASGKIAAFVFLVIFGLWCLAILGVRRMREAWAESDAARAPGGGNGHATNGNAASERPPQPDRNLELLDTGREAEDPRFPTLR